MRPFVGSARLPDVVELPVKDAHGARVGRSHPPPRAERRLVAPRLLQLRQVEVRVKERLLRNERWRERGGGGVGGGGGGGGAGGSGGDGIARGRHAVVSLNHREHLRGALWMPHAVLEQLRIAAPVLRLGDGAGRPTGPHNRRRNRNGEYRQTSLLLISCPWRSRCPIASRTASPTAAHSRPVRSENRRAQRLHIELDEIGQVDIARRARFRVPAERRLVLVAEKRSRRGAQRSSTPDPTPRASRAHSSARRERQTRGYVPFVTQGGLPTTKVRRASQQHPSSPFLSRL
eukprot:6214435-Pleurochrysis_carterae.AAC.2